ncbi:hypothetical protein [Vulcanisaeta sp. JCM 14467]|uniref:hypothetical protein n=1 Tax=Vulcanisaeta sp. JCM 14467 TaxID=1295370 RepID=UPI0006D08FD9|nr:hypothetical protein [Vulcanisaeta sp. JCM 14467]
MNPIENFLRSRRQRDQQIDPADQARPSVEVPPTPPQAQPMQPQPLPQIPSGHAVVRGILTELNMLSPIERAIIADALGFEEPLKSISLRIGLS